MARNNQASSSNASKQARSRNGSGPQAASGSNAGGVGGASGAQGDQQTQRGQQTESSPSRSGASRSSGGSRPSAGRSSGSRSRARSSGGSSRGRSRAGSSGGVRAIGTRAVSSVREHPIPASIIGAGLAWLVLESTGLVSTGVGRRTASTLGDLGETFGERFTGAAKSTRKTVRSGASSAADTVGGAIKSGASSVARGVKKGVTTSRDAVVHTIENHPVAVCSAALAAGVLTGMMLPATMREGRLMGKRAGRLVAGARRAGGELLEQGKELAGEAVESVHRGKQRAAGGSKARRSASASR